MTSKDILLVGPAPSNVQKNIGGATVSFDLLVKYFQSENISHTVLNTKRYTNYLPRIRNFLHLSFALMTVSRNHSIIFLNTSLPGVIFLSPVMNLIKWLFGKKIVLRPFGGGLASLHQGHARWMQSWLLNRLKYYDLVFLQTQQLCQYFQNLGVNCKQLPTSRKEPRPNPPKAYQQRFVFIGQVKESKGLDVILEAYRKMAADMTLHIYGPIVEKSYAYLVKDSDIYKGVLSPSEIDHVLPTYDVLVLPTHYPGEGYPGAIIEAFAHGLPVIATHWKNIPEIVVHEERGILIPVKSPEALLNAMEHISQEKYTVMSKNARAYFQNNHEWRKVGKSMLDDLAQQSIFPRQIATNRQV